MIQTTQKTIDLLNSDGRTFKIKLVDGTTEYTDVLSFKWTASLPTYLSIGNALCTCIQCSAVGISVSIYGTWLDAYISIVGSDEWVKIGHFKAEKPTVQNGVVTFTAYDIMNEFSKIMFNKKLGTVTLEECYRAIISSINTAVNGISYIGFSNDIASLEINADMIFGYDCRSALAYIAGYVGRNCVISNTGAIEMRGFTSRDYTLNDDRIDVPELSDNTSTLNFLAASVNNATKLLSGNDGEGLEFICPIMSQERLDALYSSLSSEASPIHSFKTGKIKHLLGDFRLQLGDVISLEYGSETFTMPISSISFEFDGGLSCDIESLPLAEASALSIADSLDFTSKQNYNKIIKEITNYYLATSLDKDVTISASGWTQSTQTMTAEKRYLWNYECIELVDGTKYQTEPCIIGNFAFDGVGIESITEYYVTTETTTQPEKNEFLSMIQTPSEAKPYLWNYEKVTYTNNSSYESDIRLIGVYSKDGKSGTTYYTWIKYADNAQGEGISNEPTGKSYVGIATNKTSSTESNDPKDYKWSLMKGDKGDPGKDGTTYYTWIKYADTPTTGMSDNPETKIYMGLAYNKTTPTESINYNDYTWSLIKGEDGVAGIPGENGVTYYTWVKYADNVNGANMSDNPTDKKYIGLAYNKTTATESNNPSDYKWALFRGADGVNGKDGINGKDGVSVSKVETQYYLSASETQLTGGYWSDTAPSWEDDKYLWTRLKTTYTDGNSEYSTPVVDASWKKTTIVDEASKELNENLANALGLYVTEVTTSGTIVRYYHSKSPISTCIEGDTILVFNSSGFGICKTGWNGGNPVFNYGATFDGKAVWDILVANKIKANYIEAGIISSVESAKVQSEWNLDTGEMAFSSEDVIVKIQGKETDAESGVTTQQAGVGIGNSEGTWSFSEYGITYATVKYLKELLLWEITHTFDPSVSKPVDPYFSTIKQSDIKTTNLHCKDIYIALYAPNGDFDGEESLLTVLNSFGEAVTSLNESVTALQQKVTELETALGQTHEHTALSPVAENYVAPSCAETGSYDSVVYCATCGEEMSRETISVDATGHSDTNSDGYCDACNALMEYMLTVGNSLTVNVAKCNSQGGGAAVDISQFTLIRFVVSKKGKYTFASAQGTLSAGSSYDTYGRLYDSTKSTIIASDDDSNGNNQFKITQELEAGTYYLAVKFYQTASAGTVIISAEYAEETPTYTITAVASPTSGGTVTGSGSYASGTSATMTATANSGYTFKQWSDGVISSTRTVTVSANATYTAIFEAIASSEQTITEEVTTSVVISAANTYIYLKFVPKYSGKYTFVSLDQSSLDPDGVIYDSSKTTSLASDTKSGAVSISYDSFVAGTTYYLAIKLYSGTGTVNVKVSHEAESQQSVTVYATTNNSSMGTARLDPSHSDNAYSVGETYNVIAQPKSGYMISSLKILYGSEVIVTRTNAELIELGLLSSMNGSLLLENTVSDSQIEEGTITYDFTFETYSSGSSTTYTEDTIVDGTLYIGTNNTKIAANAYISNKTITSIIIPNTITNIGVAAFYGCTNVTSVTIPVSVTDIYVQAFYNCSSLANVYYSGTQAQWNSITIGGSNDALTNATIHYNS